MGNGISLTNALLAMAIHSRSLRSDVTLFLFWSLIANSCRIAVLVAILAVADRLCWPEKDTLITTALWGYFVFLFYEILRLHFRGSALNMPNSFSAGAN